MSQTVGLYLHIPFCRGKCAYCGFYSLPGRSEAVWDEYVRTLRKHIRETAPAAAKLTADTVFFGGGTPSLLGAKRLRILLDTVGKAFRLSKSAEITLEGNPDSLCVKELKLLRQAGFNRLSIGVQSFDDDMLRILGRPHRAADAIDAVGAAREAGFDNLSIDLLFGLPGQSVAHWSDTLNAGLACKPEHISCYGLTPEEDAPLFQGGHHPPNEDIQADMYLHTAEALGKAGYAHYEISNYCLPGRECRHNLKYWTLQPYLGLGPAAHSDFGGRRWSYISDLERYIAGVKKADALTETNEAIPMKERAGEYLMLRLRTSLGVSGNEYAQLFRASFDAAERRLERLCARGLAVRDGDRWHLTEQGFLLSNRIIGEVLQLTSNTTANT